MQSTDTGSKRPEVSLTTQVRRQCTAGVTLVLGVIWLLGCFLQSAAAATLNDFARVDAVAPLGC